MSDALSCDARPPVRTAFISMTPSSYCYEKYRALPGTSGFKYHYLNPKYTYLFNSLNNAVHRVEYWYNCVGNKEDRAIFLRVMRTLHEHRGDVNVDVPPDEVLLNDPVKKHAVGAFARMYGGILSPVGKRKLSAYLLNSTKFNLAGGGLGDRTAKGATGVTLPELSLSGRTSMASKRDSTSTAVSGRYKSHPVLGVVSNPRQPFGEAAEVKLHPKAAEGEIQLTSHKSKNVKANRSTDGIFGFDITDGQCSINDASRNKKLMSAAIGAWFRKRLTLLDSQPFKTVHETLSNGEAQCLVEDMRRVFTAVEVCTTVPDSNYNKCYTKQDINHFLDDDGTVDDFFCTRLIDPGEATRKVYNYGEKEDSAPPSTITLQPSVEKKLEAIGEPELATVGFSTFSDSFKKLKLDALRSAIKQGKASGAQKMQRYMSVLTARDFMDYERMKEAAERGEHAPGLTPEREAELLLNVGRSHQYFERKRFNQKKVNWENETVHSLMQSLRSRADPMQSRNLDNDSAKKKQVKRVEKPKNQFDKVNFLAPMMKKYGPFPHDMSEDEVLATIKQKHGDPVAARMCYVDKDGVRIFRATKGGAAIDPCAGATSKVIPSSNEESEWISENHEEFSLANAVSSSAKSSLIVVGNDTLKLNSRADPANHPCVTTQTASTGYIIPLKV